MLDKLWRRGILELPHNLLKNYLYNRKQYVRVNNCTSETKTVKIGVPQGTILGPLLFVLYINDIFDVLPNNAIVSYADDTAVLCTGNNYNYNYIYNYYYYTNKSLENPSERLIMLI